MTTSTTVRLRQWSAAVVALLVALAGTTVIGAGTAGASPANTLTSGQVLADGSTLQSTDSRFTVAMQTDGNFVLYAESRAVWSAGTAGNPGAFAVMQTDGNLVVYTAGGQARWSSGSAGNPGAVAAVQDDGNFVVYSAGGQAKWSSGTAGVLDQETWLLPSGYGFGRGSGMISENGRYGVILQNDGNLVLYDGWSGKALWSAATNGPAPETGTALVMHEGGDLVVIDEDGYLLWESGSDGNPGAVAVIQNDGNFVVYSTGGRALWSSGTGR